MDMIIILKEIIVLDFKLHCFIIDTMKHVSDQSNIHSIKLLLFWFISACLAGIIGTLIVYIFNFLYTMITSLILNNLDFPVFIYPILGAILVGSVIYRIEPKSMGEGLPSYLASLKDKNLIWSTGIFSRLYFQAVSAFILPALSVLNPLYLLHVFMQFLISKLQGGCCCCSRPDRLWLYYDVWNYFQNTSQRS